MIIEEELSHYGVKGMKWGVRRNTSSSNGSSKNVSKTKKNSSKKSKRKETPLQRADRIKRNVDTARLIAVGTGFAALYLHDKGVNKVLRNRAMRPGNAKQITNGLKFAKKHRGAFKITSL